MILNLVGNTLHIDWEWPEQLWGCNLKSSWCIPLDRIAAVSLDEPVTHWTDLRAPGTFWPGVIRAGTYRTKRGKEFWYVTGKREGHYLTLELQGEAFDRIVLTVAAPADWRDRILQQQKKGSSSEATDEARDR